MAKKIKRKDAATTVSRRTPRSHKKELNFEDPEEDDKKNKVEELEKEEKTEEDAESSGEQSAWEYYMDRIEDSVTFPNVFQLALIFFLANMVFLLYTQGKDDLRQKNDVKDTTEEDQGDPLWPIVTGGLAGGAAFLQLIVVCYSSYKNYTGRLAATEDEDEKEAIEKPQLPEFGYIYAIFAPLAVSLIKYPAKIAAIAPCIAQVPYLNPMVKVVVSFVTMYQIGIESKDATFFEIALSPLVLAASYFLLEHFLKESLSITERTLFSYLAVALLVFVDDNSDVSLVIFQKLFMAFGAGLGLAACLGDIYRSQTPGSIAQKAVLTVIYVVFFGNSIVLSYKFLYPILGQAPWTWIVDYIRTDPQKLAIFKLWATSSAVFVPSILTFAKYIPFELRRKVWHFAIFAALAYPIIIEPQLTSLALVGLFGVFCLVELARAYDLPPFGGFLRKILAPFEDKKDSKGPFVLSYLLLVLGVAVPLWLNNCSVGGSSVIGLITLGLGDSLASLIGKAVGKIYWPETSKTAEGSFFFLISTALALYGYQTQEKVGYDDYAILITSFITAALEGNLQINDNLLVPVMGWISLEVLQRARY
ncbi:DEKNAAC102033 [Brettanomyces naardenensis]|uniref:dolichol kinase n=1 Tax=Brettanomyces naardenensis TaxID=13370 RepID=A0A448YJM1_BRENA|nr:DEKNAAC102033 [Brettanomyces naardenensis]